MSVRVSPTEKIRHEIDALFEEGIDLARTLEQVARLDARLIIQTAVRLRSRSSSPSTGIGSPW